MRQVINSRPNISLENASDSFQANIQDIVEKITIESNFSITYPDYKPLELSAESVERFQKLPQDLQHKYLSLQLCAFILGIYFSRSLRTIDEEIANSAQDKIEANTTLGGVDVVFFDRLHTNNHGQGYGNRGWRVLQNDDDDNLVVIKDELTLHIKRDRHLYPNTQSAVVGQLVSIRLPKNKVDSRNYIAIANTGSHESGNLDGKQQSVCIYLNFEAEGAVIFMDGLTKQLNVLGLPFSFKVPYNPWDYKRCNSGRLCFNKQDYETVKSVLQPIYLANQTHFDSECPFLTKILAPGIALAEEPDVKFSEEEGYGKNRCQVIANGLLEAWHKGEDSPDSKIATIMHHFHKNGIDLKQPYLNFGSQDIYYLWNI